MKVEDRMRLEFAVDVSGAREGVDGAQGYGGHVEQLGSIIFNFQYEA